MFLGEQYSVWQSPADLLPFRAYSSEKELAASELIYAGKMPRHSHFQKGLEVLSLTLILIIFIVVAC